MTDQSRAPRTDEKVKRHRHAQLNGADYVPADFARTLELEAADLRERLAKARQEPVARVKRNSGCSGREFIGESLEFRDLPVGTKLYTAPPSGVREGMLRAAEICSRLDLDFQDGECDPSPSDCAEAITRAAEPVNAEGPRKLWLWKNFVDGRPEYWAFDNPYPTYGGGDPMTLGEPCGYALFKESTISPRHVNFSEADVIAAIQRAAAKEQRK